LSSINRRCVLVLSSGGAPRELLRRSSQGPQLDQPPSWGRLFFQLAVAAACSSAARARNCIMGPREFSGTISAGQAYPWSLLKPSPRIPMNILPVDRALRIYGALADRSETKGARERLSRHLLQRYIDGEKDQHRLTVEGLSYLQKLDREIDSRN
jgi:hypothetical protein